MSTTSGTTIDLLSSSSGDDYSSVGGGGSRSTPTVEGDDEEEDPFMDCRRLLEEVSSLEAYHAMRLASEATNFGHPEPPRIHIFSLEKGKVKHHSNHRNSDNNNSNNNLLLVVAYTNHSVCAQIIGHDKDHTKSSSLQNDPIHICTLPIMQVTQQQQQQRDGTRQSNNKKHQANSRTASAAAAAAATAAAWNEQVITCITVVALQESTLRSSSSSLSPSSAHATDRENDDDDNDNDDASQEEEEEEEEEEKTASLLPQHLVSKNMVRSSSSSSSSSSVLLKGVVSSGGGVMMDQAYTSMSSSSSSSRSAAATAAAAVVKNRRLAVVVGTSENRVYSTEVVYHVHECRIQVVLAEASLSNASSCSLFEVLPKCNGSSSGHQRSKSKSSSKNNKTTPFFPTGGVSSISAFSLPTFSAGRLQPKQHHGKRRRAPQAHLPGSMTTYVWITYRDGTLIRMHHAGLFPSVWERGAACEKTLDDLLLHVGGGGVGPSSSNSHDQVSAALVRCQVQLPPLDLDGDGSNDHNGSSSQNNNVTIIPLPRYHASPLAPLPASSLHFDDTDHVDDFDSFIDEDDTGDPQRQADQEEDGPLYSNVYDALVFAGAGMDHFPTLCFYTSEESSFPHARGVGDSDAIRGDYDSRTGSGRRLGGSSGGNGDSESAVLGAVVGGTKAFMGGVVGALRWGLGGGGGSSSNARASAAAATTSTTSLGRNTSQFSTTSSTSNINNNSMDDSRSVDYSVGYTSQDGTVATSSGMSVSTHGAGGVDVPSSPFPSLWDHPVSLYAGLEFHDAPRKVEFCSIDPDGVLAAVADGLGRVMLIDLTTKQVIRLWKGYREATCHWIQGYCTEREEQWNTNSRTNIAKTAPKPSWKRKSAKYLVVHSRLRRVVEVWKIRHGSRVTSIPVGRDAQIVPCTLGLYPNHLASCFILHRSAPGGSGGGGRSSISCMQANQLEKIQVDQHQRLLQQHQMQHHQEAEFLVATKGGSVGGGRGMLSQHSLRLQHLRQILSTTNFQYSKDDVHQALLQIKALGDLATCLDLIATASVLEERLGVQGSSFQKLVLDYCRTTLEEAMKGSGDGKLVAVSAASPNAKLLMRKIQYHARIITAYDIIRTAASTKGGVERGAKPPSHFCAEALGWTSTFEQVTRASLDMDVPLNSNEPLRYSSFASSFLFPIDAERSNLEMKIFLSESSRTRKVLLGHVFKPILLGDIYSLSAVSSFFETLGIQDELSYILKCFGEWFMTLRVDDIIKKGIVVSQSCLNRFLASMVNRQLESKVENTVALDVLYKFCEESIDLVRAFMLSALCREAIKKVADQKEKRTYGKLSSMRLLRFWEVLLRRLRVCLLVSLRLKEVRNGPIPLSVQHVNTEGMFSVYEWVARDELSVSHHHEEILSLEMACKNSSYVFDPSLSAGDDPSRFKVLQDACLALAITEEERAEFLVDHVSEDSGALLLFLSSHNEPVILAAHRALLLAAEWSREPRHLQVFRDSLMSLRSLTDSPRNASLALAVRLEVWTRVVCPIYRARLFGFDDVQELSEDVVAPLLQDKEWTTEFGPMALLVLDMLSEISWNDCESSSSTAILASAATGNGTNTRETWPPVKPDCILKKLVDKLRKIDTGATDAHCAICCALLVSNNIESLVKCAPTIYQCFLPASLFTPAVASPPGSPEQDAFLADAAVDYARKYNGPPMDSFQGLEELEMMCKLWGFGLDMLWTYYLLAMYGFAKDHFVDDLLTKVYSQIDVKTFVNGGVDLACCRLAAFLEHLHRQSASTASSSSSNNGNTNTDMRDVMGVLDADACDWIQERAQAAKPLVGTAGLNTDISVASTHLFALRLLSLSASAEIEASLRAKIHSMAVLSGILNKL